MTVVRSILVALAAVGLVGVLAGCGGGDGSSLPDDEVTTTGGLPSSSVSTQPQAPSTTTTSTTGAGPAEVPSLLELRGDLDVAVVVLEPTTEGGSHPTLSWQPASGAESYWLVVRGADGRPYWAWTGTSTSVRVGGGDRSDTNQTAALHEAMTWRVAAFDAAGVLIGLSDPASLTP